MNTKRIIAREWLYLLGFAGFACLVAVLLLFVLMPHTVDNVSLVETQFSEQDEASILKNLDSVQCRLFDSLATLGKEFQGAVQWRQTRADRVQAVLDQPVAWPGVYMEYHDILAIPTRLPDGSRRNLLDNLDSAETLLGTFLSTPTGQDIFQRVLGSKDSLYNVAVNNARTKYELRQRYERNVATLNSLSYYAGVVPYPLFLFLRSIIWAVRQVRRRFSSQPS